jgi:hypothetical protein
MIFVQMGPLMSAVFVTVVAALTSAVFVMPTQTTTASWIAQGHGAEMLSAIDAVFVIATQITIVGCW